MGFFAVSPDEQYVIPFGNPVRPGMELPNTRVFRLPTGEPAGPLLNVGEAPTAAAFSPDGDRVLTTCRRTTDGLPAEDLSQGTGRGSFSLWDWHAEKRLFPSMPTPSAPVGAAFSPDGHVAVVVCAGGEILMLNPQTGAVERELNHGARLNALANTWQFLCFSPRGEVFATFGLGNTSCVWDTTSGRRLFECLTPNAPCNFVDFSADGHLLLTASQDGLVRIWETVTGRTIAELQHSDWVYSARFNRQGTQVLTACRDHQARLWQWQENELACPAFEHEDEVFDARFCRDETAVATAGRDGSLVIWDALTAKPLMPSRRWPNKLHSVFVTNDSKYAVVAGELPSLYVERITEFDDPFLDALPNEAMRRLTEITSGKQLHGGGGVVNLSVKQWLDRWRTFRAAYPDFHPISR
jgi:WD40 repeat protein